MYAICNLISQMWLRRPAFVGLGFYISI